MFVVHCPICRKSVTYEKREEAPFRPFCSEQCKNVDLGRWLTEGYRISQPLNTEGDELPTPDDAPDT